MLQPIHHCVRHDASSFTSTPGVELVLPPRLLRLGAEEGVGGVEAPVELSRFERHALPRRVPHDDIEAGVLPAFAGGGEEGFGELQLPVERVDVAAQVVRVRGHALGPEPADAVAQHRPSAAGPAERRGVEGRHPPVGQGPQAGPLGIGQQGRPAPGLGLHLGALVRGGRGQVQPTLQHVVEGHGQLRVEQRDGASQLACVAPPGSAPVRIWDQLWRSAPTRASPHRRLASRNERGFPAAAVASQRKPWPARPPSG